MSGRRSIPLAAGAGLLVTLTVPPFGWWPLAVVGIAVLSVALLGAGLRRRMLLAFVFGAALYVPSLWWMTQFSLPGGIIVGLIQATMTMLGLLVVHTRDRSALLATLPAGIVAADVVRSLWPFGGLPLGGIDLGQAGGPFARLTPFGGRLLVIGAVAVLGAALGHVLAGRAEAGAPGAGAPEAGAPEAGAPEAGRWRLAGPAGVAAAVIAATGLAAIAPDGTHPTGTVTRVAAVQGGGPLGLRASPANARRTYEAAVAATARVPAGVELILWPENVVDVPRLEGSPELARLRQIARTTGATLLAGVTEDAGPGRFTNFQVAIAPDGRIADRFDKVRRVPYGEYFPFRPFIESLGITLPATDAVAGSGPGVLRTPVGTFAVLISYEGFFDDRSRGGVRAGGEIVLLPTNTASYTSSMVPTQQLAAARLRALETGRWVVQASPTGVNAVIDHHGRVLATTPRIVADVLDADVPHRRGLTPYTRFNDAPAMALAALAVAGTWAPQRRRRRTRAAGTSGDPAAGR
jgi:apolipoprotein N-acyltransferase